MNIETSGKSKHVGHTHDKWTNCPLGMTGEESIATRAGAKYIAQYYKN